MRWCSARWRYKCNLPRLIKYSLSNHIFLLIAVVFTIGLGLMVLGFIADAYGVPLVIHLLAILPALAAVLALLLPDLRQQTGTAA